VNSFRDLVYITPDVGTARMKSFFRKSSEPDERADRDIGAGFDLLLFFRAVEKLALAICGLDNHCFQ
jgi:hypothetical protein